MSAAPRGNTAGTGLASTSNPPSRHSSSSADPHRAAMWRTARWLAFAMFLIYAVTGGGRVVGSDEVTMLEISRAMLQGRIDVPEGATLRGSDGRYYSKNAAGQALLALPLVGLSDIAARVAGLDAERRVLAVRFGVSFFNAIVTAILIAAIYLTARFLGLGGGASFGAALMLAFTTPVWPYAKSFMAEPLQALGLLLAVAGVSLIGSRSAIGRGPEVAAAVGAFLAVSAKLSMLPLATACLVPLLGVRPARWRLPLAGLALALVGHAIYNVARFGNPLETGYGAQATPAAYTTPLLVGLYGLLLSSGKGVLWFAPVLWLAPAGWRAMMRLAGAGEFRLTRFGLGTAPGRAAWGVLLAWVAGLLLYSRFQHWAGDGSFGPRYLIPLLPLAMIPVAFALEGPASAPARRAPPVRVLAGLLAAVGLAVQIGGVSVYFGAQMREAGDYPYQLPLADPRFMSESHFNPHFTPIVGHWRLLLRNLGEHMRGEGPRLGAQSLDHHDRGAADSRDPRLGLTAEDQQQLLHALDFWWLYLVYAGLPRAPVWGAVLVLTLLAIWAMRRAFVALGVETRGS